MEFKGTEGKWEIMMDGDEIKIIQADSLENGAGWRSYIAICEEVQCIEDANLIAASPDLIKVGASEDVAKNIITAIVKGEVFATKITY